MADMSRYYAHIDEVEARSAERRREQEARRLSRPQPGQNRSALGDTMTDLKAGALRAPGTVAALADIPFGLAFDETPIQHLTGAIGEATGFQPGRWGEEAQRNLSPARQAADARVNVAKEEAEALRQQGKWGQALGRSITGVLSEPRSAIGLAAQSLPEMVVGGLAGRGLRAAGIAKNPYVAAGAGEGLIMAGHQMGDLTKEGIDPRTAAAAGVVTGALGGAMGVGGGYLSKRLGVFDPDVLMVAGREGVEATASTTLRGSALNMARRVGGGAITEGLFEEFPQETMEAIVGNIAAGRDPMENAIFQGIQGAAAGGIMGGTINIVSPRAAKETRATTNPRDLLRREEERRARAEQGELEFGYSGEEAIGTSGIINPYDVAGRVSAVQRGEETGIDTQQMPLFGEVEALPEDTSTPFAQLRAVAPSAFKKNGDLNSLAARAFAAYSEMDNEQISLAIDELSRADTAKWRVPMLEYILSTRPQEAQDGTARVAPASGTRGSVESVGGGRDLLADARVGGGVRPDAPAPAPSLRADTPVGDAGAADSTLTRVRQLNTIINHPSAPEQAKVLARQELAQIEEAQKAVVDPTMVPTLLSGLTGKQREVLVGMQEAVGTSEEANKTAVAEALGISKQALNGRLKSARKAMTEAAQTRYGLTKAEAEKRIADYFLSRRTTEAADETRLGDNPNEQAQTVDLEEVLGGDGVDQSMGTIQSVGGTQSRTDEDMEATADEVARAVARPDPVAERRAAEAHAKREAAIAEALAHPIAPEAMEDWNSMRSEGAPTAAELDRDSALEWILNFARMKDGEITANELDQIQLEIEREFQTASLRDAGSEQRAIGSEPRPALQQPPEVVAGDGVTDPETAGTPEVTPEDEAQANNHAKAIGGEVVWMQGEYALVRGYSIVTGAPVYAATKGGQRTVIDIDSFTGTLIPPPIREQMLAEKQRLELAASSLHASSPFIVFDSPVVVSEGVPVAVAGIVREWVRLLGIKANIYITTSQQVRKDKDKFTGPHRVIASATIVPAENGVMRKMRDGNYYIILGGTQLQRVAALELLAHELGHIHEREVYASADAATKRALRIEFETWRKAQKDATARDLVTSLRARATGKATRGSSSRMAKDLPPYWTSFSEWYADQVSRWATTSRHPVNAVERFFARLGRALHRFYTQVRNQKYLPNATFQQYLDTVADRAAETEADTETAGTPEVTEEVVEEAPTVKLFQVINRLRILAKQPDHKAIATDFIERAKAGEDIMSDALAWIEAVSPDMSPMPIEEATGAVDAAEAGFVAGSSPLERRVAALRERLGERQRATLDRLIDRFTKREITFERFDIELETLEAKAAQGVQYSKTEAPQPTTVDAVWAALKDITSDIRQGKVVVVQSADALVERGLLKSEAARGVQGFVDNKGTAYFIADNIKPGLERAVVLHEIGAHLGIENILPGAQYLQLVNKVVSWAESGKGLEGYLARRAIARVDKAGTEGVMDQQKELIAYFIEEAVIHGVDPTALQYKSEMGRWFRTLWAAFKRAVRRLGTVNADKLTAQDVVDLAYGAARIELSATYHGTAAAFRRFNHAFMGKGEGFQYYGWGSYVAQRFGIAREYFKQDVQRKGGDRFKSEALGKTLAEHFVNAETGELLVRAGTIVIEGARKALPIFTPGEIGHTTLARLMRNLGSDYITLQDPSTGESSNLTLEEVLGKPRNEGNIHIVDTIVTPEEMLDWDVPLDQQPAVVAEALERINAALTPSGVQGLIRDYKVDRLQDLADVEWFIRIMPEMIGNGRVTVEGEAALRHVAEGNYRAALSMWLNEMGVKGIRFLDAMSRTGETDIVDSAGDIAVMEGSNEQAALPFSNGFASIEEAIEEARRQAVEYPNMLRLAVAMEGWLAKGYSIKPRPQTRNLVIFDDRNLYRVASHRGGSVREGGRLLFSYIGERAYDGAAASHPPLAEAKAALAGPIPIEGQILYDRVLVPEGAEALGNVKSLVALHYLVSNNFYRAVEDARANLLFNNETEAVKELDALSASRFSLYKKGAFEEQVRQRTGWFKGPDNKWRYELDDNMASLKTPFDEMSSNNRLGDVLHHPKLFSAYPDLADLPVRKQVMEMDGMFDGDMIAINPNTNESPLEILMHEIQHWIQAREGFANGGTPNSMRLDNLGLLDRLVKFARAVYSGDRSRLLNFERYVQDARDIQPELKEIYDLRAEAYTELEAIYNEIEARKDRVDRILRREWLAHQQQVAKRMKDYLRAPKHKKEETLNLLRSTQRMFDLNERQEELYFIYLGALRASYADAQVKVDAHSWTVSKTIGSAAASELHFAAYQILQGEREARDVQARLRMDPMMRHATPPYWSEGIPDEVVTIEYSPISVSASTSNSAQLFSKADTEQNARESNGLMSRILKSLPQPVQDRLTALNTRVKQVAYLGAFSSDLVDMVSKHLPQAGSYFDTIFQRQSERTSREADLQAILDPLAALPQKEIAQVNELLLDSAFQEEWAFDPDWVEGAEVNGELNERFEALPPEAQKAVIRMFRKAHELRVELDTLMEEDIDTTYSTMMLRAKSKKQRKKLEDQYNRVLSGFNKRKALYDRPYLPLKRWGEFAVVMRSQAFRDAQAEGDHSLVEKMKADPSHYRVTFTESEVEALDLRRRWQEETGNPVDAPFPRADFVKRNEHMPFELLQRLKAQVTEGTDEPSKAIHNALDKLYIQALEETSIRKSELHRRKVYGMDHDMIRAFRDHGVGHASMIAALTINKETQGQIAAMREAAFDPTISGEVRKNRILALNEVMARHALSLDYNETWSTNLVRKAMGTTSIWMLLSSPAYYIQNATQPFMLTLPVLAAKFNPVQAADHMFEAYKHIWKGWEATRRGKSGEVMNIDAALAAGGITESEAVMLRRLQNRGLLDIGIAADLGSLETAKSQVGKVVNRVHRKMITAARTVELANRGVTALAAYRLELARLEQETQFGEAERHARATEYAEYVTSVSQGDYSQANAPRFIASSPVMRLITQFRKFQLIQIGLLARSYHKAFHNADAIERGIGKRQLSYILGMHGLVGGAMGLPAMNVVGMVLGWAMGGDDPPDFETRARRAIGDKDTADLILKGLPAYLGVDASTRLGMGMTFSLMPFTQVSMSRDGAAVAMANLMGPGAGLLMRFADGVRHMNQGNAVLGVANFMPGAVGNTLKALDARVSGVYTRNYKDVLLTPDEVSFMASFSQAMGWPIKSISDPMMMRGKKFEAEAHFNERAQKVRRAYIEAYRSGDGAARRSAMEDWRALQATRREWGFSAQPLSNLLRAPRDQTKRERETLGGVQATRTSRGFVELLQR